MKIINKKIFLTFLITFIIILSFFLVLLVLSNTTNLKNGKIYYSNIEAYCYDIKTKTKHKITIPGYEYVTDYIPFEDGYFAIANVDSKENEFQDSILLHNDEVLVKANGGIYNINIVGNFIFYQKEYCKLCAVNYVTKDSYEFDNGVYFGYSNVNNYVYYGNSSCDNPDKESSILVIDCNSNIPISKVIDTGIICRNTNNELVYSKNDKLLCYDFNNEKSSIADSKSLKYDNLRNRYLGSIDIDNNEFDIVYHQDVLYGNNYSDDNDFERAMLKTIVLDYYRCMGFIKIYRNSGSLYIPCSKYSQVCVHAIEFKGKTYYTNIASNYYIY